MKRPYIEYSMFLLIRIVALISTDCERKIRSRFKIKITGFGRNGD